MLNYLFIYIHTYHSRFIPEGVAEASQIFLRDTHVLPKLVMRNTANVTDGKSIAVLLQSISRDINCINLRLIKIISSGVRDKRKE
jgi:hypothetical protein